MSGEKSRPTEPPEELELLGRVRRTVQRVWASLVHNGYLKLGALLLALVFWVFVRNDNTLISQRTFRAPLNVEGLAANRTVPSLPERVTVRLSGPSSRIRALNPAGVDVVLNLRGVTGEFEEEVRVFPPQGISLISVTPREIIGTVEARAEKRVPVRPLLAPAPAGAQIEVAPNPAEVVVRGAESSVMEVAEVVVPFDPEQPRDLAAPYAVAENGRPVAGVSVTPGEVRLQATRSDVLYSKRVPVSFSPTELPGLEVRSAALLQTEVMLVGPQEALETLEGVSATLPETPPLRPGRYTLDVTLELPEGVAAVGTPQVALELRATAPDTAPDTTDQP
jgi:YbbR domain-containing protein